MAHNPTDPGADGAAHLAVLTDYAEWSYDAAGDPVAPPAETTADATVASKTVASVVEALDAPALDASGAPSVEGPDAPPGAGSAWARWVLKGLRAELQRQSSDPRASPKRRAALAQAIVHLKVWK